MLPRTYVNFAAAATTAETEAKTTSGNSKSQRDLRREGVANERRLVDGKGPQGRSGPLPQGDVVSLGGGVPRKLAVRQP